MNLRVAYTCNNSRTLVLIFVVVCENPTNKDYTDCDDNDSDNDTRRGSHFFN